jgi:hypothetical protein
MSPLRPLRRRPDAVDDPDDGPARLAAAASGLADALGAATRYVTALTRTVGFWLGVVLPFLHVPLLLFLGLTESTTPTLVGLWGLNAVAVAVGAGHDPAGADPKAVDAPESDRDATAATAD